MGRPTKANTEKASAEKPVRIKIDSDYLIPVKSNVGGVLYYKSKKTGYEEVWDETGIVIEMEWATRARRFPPLRGKTFLESERDR